MTAEPIIALHKRNAQAAADQRWYAEARAESRRRARALGVPINRYLAVVAAMSPLQQWRRKDGGWPNLDSADRVFRGEGRGLPTALNMANRIAAGERPNRVLGRKTLSFYRNLQSNMSSAVTIDRWMMRAFGLPYDSPRSANEYNALADLVRQAATQLDIQPHALQASVWAQIKRESEAS